MEISLSKLKSCIEQGILITESKEGGWRHMVPGPWMCLFKYRQKPMIHTFGEKHHNTLPVFTKDKLVYKGIHQSDYTGFPL